MEYTILALLLLEQASSSSTESVDNTKNICFDTFVCVNSESLPLIFDQDENTEDENDCEHTRNQDFELFMQLKNI